MNEYGTTSGRGEAMRRWPMRATAVILIGILTTAACGGTETDLGSEPVDSGDRTTVTTGPTTATTVTAADEGEVGPSGGPDTTRQVYDGAGGKLVALLDDVLGPTDDVSDELARLSPHPSFPTPNGGAYLVGFAVSANPPESERRSNVVKVQFLADAPVDDLPTFYEAYYVGEGWEPSERSVNEGDFGPTTELVLNDYFDEGSVSIGGRSLHFRVTHYVE